MTEWMDARKTPEGRASAAKWVRAARELGHSYEQITLDVADFETGARPAPWEVYALANPQKSAEQVAAWKAKHHPDG